MQMIALERPSFLCVHVTAQRKNKSDKLPLVAKDPIICDDIKMARGLVVCSIDLSGFRGPSMSVNPRFEFCTSGKSATKTEELLKIDEILSVRGQEDSRLTEMTCRVRFLGFQGMGLEVLVEKSGKTEVGKIFLTKKCKIFF